MAALNDAFTCPCCWMISRNSTDLEQGYCGRCHWWTADPILGPPHLAEECAARTESLCRADAAAVLDDDLDG